MNIKHEGKALIPNRSCLNCAHYFDEVCREKDIVISSPDIQYELCGDWIPNLEDWDKFLGKIEKGGNKWL